MTEHDAAVSAMQRVGVLLAGALLAEDGDSFVRYQRDAQAIIEEWYFTDEMVVWAHDEAARLVPSA